MNSVVKIEPPLIKKEIVQCKGAKGTVIIISAASNVQVHTPLISALNHQKPQRSVSTVKESILLTTKLLSLQNPIHK